MGYSGSHCKQRPRGSGVDSDIAIGGHWTAIGVQGLVSGLTDVALGQSALSWVLSLADGLSDLGPIQWLSRLVDGH